MQADLRRRNIEAGGFYGWPWYYTGENEDPAHAGEDIVDSFCS